MDWFNKWSQVTNLGRLFYAILVDLGDAVESRTFFTV